MEPKRSFEEILKELYEILARTPNGSDYKKSLEETIKQLVESDKLKNGRL